MTRCLIVLMLSAVVVLALQRCTFEPSNEYINPIPPPEPITVNIEVNDPKFTDPFYIIEATNFIFTLKDLTKPVVDYAVTIDGYTIAQGNDENIQFFLFPHSVNEGVHKVKILIRLATQSGSLAEKLGSEFYYIEKTFQLINDRTIPPSLEPIAAYENGRLTIRWNTITQENFYYVIKRTYTPYDPLRDSIIRNSELNTFIDEGYVGGKVTYTIAATGFGFESRELGSVTFEDEPVDFELSESEGKRVSLVWTNSKVAVENIDLTIETNGRITTIPMTSSGSLLIDTLVLGEETNYWLRTSRAGYGRQTFTRTRGLKSQQQVKAFNSQIMLADQNRLLLLTPKAIYRYALPSLVAEDSLLYRNNEEFTGMVANEDGSRAVLTTANKNLYEFNPMDFDAPLNELGLYSATISVTGGSDGISQIVLGNLSQNGLLTMVIGKYGNNTQLVYDINNNVVLWSASPFQYLNAVYPPVVSSDGRYLSNDYPALTKGDVYQWNGSGFDQIGIVAVGRKHFRPGNNEIISGTIKENVYQISSGSINIYDLATLPADPTQTLLLRRSMNFPAIDKDAYFWETGYDHTTDLFYVRFMENAYSTLTLYDANTMLSVKQVRAFTYTPYTHEFVSHYHMTNRGYIEELK